MIDWIYPTPPNFYQRYLDLLYECAEARGLDPGNPIHEHQLMLCRHKARRQVAGERLEYEKLVNKRLTKLIIVFGIAAFIVVCFATGAFALLHHVGL